MKKILCMLLIIVALAVCLGLNDRGSGAGSDVGAGGGSGADRSRPLLAYVRAQFMSFAVSADSLETAIRDLDQPGVHSLAKAKDALRSCRLHYKKIEFFLDYFLRSSALIYNQPARYEAEEPYLEYEAPRGLPMIESLLFGPLTDSAKVELRQEATAVRESAGDLGALLYELPVSDAELLESTRIGLIRVMALGITSYDAPQLQSGVAESYEAMESMQACLSPYLAGHSGEADSVGHYLRQCLGLLSASPGFVGFDRMDFLTRAALPLQRHLGKYISGAKLTLNHNAALNYGARDLFAADAINLKAFPGEEEARLAKAQVIELGKRLFIEKALSGNFSRSCASCHLPERSFADGLPRSVGIDGHSPVRRNAPSLEYAAYQYAQFWDGRASSLEQQIGDVLQNPAEMNADLSTIGARLERSSFYRRAFAGAFPSGGAPSARRAIEAIAAYIRGLAPLNSAFDHYLAGDPKALDPEQIDGFNLFMGKARCGTCHFIPLFNGLQPPRYDLTEFEVLGTPSTADLDHPVADTDLGRMAVIPIPFYQGAFKTPTLRNVAATAPYMHGGNFPTLEKVMEFYNRGGGNGIGLLTADQTLSSDSLRLSAMEIGEIIAFLRALTDLPRGAGAAPAAGRHLLREVAGRRANARPWARRHSS